MKKVIINVLASDFKSNSYMNLSKGLDGCPLQRAFIRGGVFAAYEDYYQNHLIPFTNEPDKKVQAMFSGEIPIQDFSFEVEIEEQP